MTTRCAICAEGSHATVRSCGADREHGRAHVQIGHDRLVRHHGHLGLACGAGGQIENGVVGGLHIAPSDAGKSGSLAIARVRAPAARSRVIAPSASPVSRMKWRTSALLSVRKVFGSSTNSALRAAGPDGAEQIRRRVVACKAQPRSSPMAMMPMSAR